MSRPLHLTLIVKDTLFSSGREHGRFIEGWIFYMRSQKFLFGAIPRFRQIFDRCPWKLHIYVLTKLKYSEREVSVMASWPVRTFDYVTGISLNPIWMDFCPIQMFGVIFHEICFTL